LIVAVPGIATADETDSHCAVGVSPITPGQPTPAPVITCFSTFAESMEFATRGKVQLDAADATVSAQQLVESGAVATANALAAGPLLGVEYDGSNYSGGSLALYGTGGSGCYGVTYGFAGMPGGWNDRVSSARAYSGCDSWHYDSSGYRGSVRVCATVCSGFGAMTNRTSSIVFR
jgi:hypothetical protein